MRLQQRLKRSLQSEHSIRNANEDLLLKLHEAEPAEAAEVRAAPDDGEGMPFSCVMSSHPVHMLIDRV